MLVLSLQESELAKESELAILKETDISAYLSTLYEYDQKRWLSELAIHNPDEHKIVTARMAEEESQLEAKAEAEAKAKAEAKAEAEAKAVAKTKVEAINKRAKECGKKNEITAYVMSQSFIERRLKAPSTAEFPWITEISARAVGNCEYQIDAYVDAQNSFGAMLRNYYTAKLRYYPESEKWQLLDAQIGE